MLVTDGTTLQNGKLTRFRTVVDIRLDQHYILSVVIVHRIEV